MPLSQSVTCWGEECVLGFGVGGLGHCWYRDIQIQFVPGGVVGAHFFEEEVIVVLS